MKRPLKRHLLLKQPLKGKRSRQLKLLKRKHQLKRRWKTLKQKRLLQRTSRPRIWTTRWPTWNKSSPPKAKSATMRTKPMFLVFHRFKSG